MKPTAQEEKDRVALRFAMTLSLLIGFLMLVMKLGAYYITGSAAILSDAAESVVHVIAVSFAAYSLRMTFRPPDARHLYGYEKVSFFSAGFEGSMIGIAAIFIIYEAVHKWITGLALENLGLGTGLTAVAAAINAGLGGYLLWLGKKKNSVILEANGKHVLTDCYTSAGVLIGLGLALATGWLPWDPICAILMALNILASGFGLIRKSVRGLMDVADPEIDKQLKAILDREAKRYDIRYHGLHHRSLGVAYQVEFHLLFPAETTIKAAHMTATAIEHEIESSLQPGAHVTTHLEAIEDHQQVHSPHTH